MRVRIKNGWHWRKIPCVTRRQNIYFKIYLVGSTIDPMNSSDPVLLSRIAKKKG
jgi:hypothetical protein